MHRGDYEVPLVVSSYSKDFKKKYEDECQVLKRPVTREEHVMKKGKVLRDEQGELVMQETEESRQNWRDFFQRYTAIRLRDCLRNSTGLTWDTQEPDTQDVSQWMAYAKDLYNEVKGSFTDSEISRIFEIADSLECRIDVDKAMESFSQDQEEEDL